MAEKLAAGLQQSVLATLVFDAEWGAAIASQVTADNFDTVYRDFASRVITFRRKQGKPPGKAHLEDLAEQASAGKDKSLVRQLVPQLLDIQDGLNTKYVATRVGDFVRRQRLKGALTEAIDRYGIDDESMPDDVERIFYDALRFRQQTFEVGTFLKDVKALRFLDWKDVEVVSLGIRELDRARIGLIPKQLLLYIASKGAGKSWFCVHCGKQALLQRLKVVHYSLEMAEEEVIPRYYQSLFSVALDDERFNRTTLEFDELGRLSGFKTRLIKPSATPPRLHLEQSNIKQKLKAKLNTFGARIGGLLVKSFPTGQATISQITSHLDYLEEVEGFVPSVLIVDYPKLMKIDRSNPRLSIGGNVEDLRGLAVQRNMALVAPHQGTRSTIGAKRTKSKDAGEDISVVQTADTVLAFSRTEAEERLGLGRLSLEHSRRSRGGLLLLLSQSLDTGQYVLGSAVMQKAYWDKLRAVSGDDGSDEDDE